MSDYPVERYSAEWHAENTLTEINGRMLGE